MREAWFLEIEERVENDHVQVIIRGNLENWKNLIDFLLLLLLKILLTIPSWNRVMELP